MKTTNAASAARTLVVTLVATAALVVGCGGRGLPLGLRSHETN